MSAARMPAFPLVKLRAAYRNRTDDLFHYSVSERRTPSFRIAQVRSSDRFQYVPERRCFCVHCYENCYEAPRHPPLLQDGPPHARERMRRPFGYPVRATGRNNPR
jgi:hypothetical protein